MSQTSKLNWHIPEQWKLISIGDLTSDWRGGASFKPEDFREHGFPVLHKGAIQKGGNILIDAKKKTFTTEDYANKNKKSVIDKSYMAVTLRDLVPSGPSIGLIANLANSPSSKYILAQGAYGFQADITRLEPNYLVWLSNYEPFREYIKSYSVGSTQIHIRTPVFQELQIPLPPLEEQQRIAAILDKADAVRKKRSHAIQLTEELLRATFLDMFGDPVTNPKGWEIKPMSEVIENIQAGWSTKGEERQCEKDEWGVLKISAVTFGRFKPYENKVVKDIPLGKSLIIPKRGDLLFSRANTRELVAATCLVEKDYERLFLPDKLWRIIPNSKFSNSEYLKFLLTEPKYRSLLAQKATGTSGSMLNISQQKLLEMDAPMPDVDKQNFFAKVVWKILEMRERYELACIDSKSLFNSLLHRAFTGKL